ncbi:MAG: TrkA family potassium uptake protein, partial [Polyangiaceae bacterium]|nr:TrkA family potassium uptake protein [Polyangiaceae bacterium]
MARQAIVIGLGQFGMAVARALSERRVEVLAIDLSEDRVRAVAPFVAEAAAFDATNEEALARTSPERRDLCVCAIGDESRESSIICTAMLRQMGAPRIVARANDPMHERILGLVGAHRVVNPEREYGQRIV